LVKNKLHIFGCSHSTGVYRDDNNKPFWADYIAESLGLQRFPRVGQSGKNVEYILFDMLERILNNDISKSDTIILNTSYPLRFGTPRLQNYNKNPLDYDFDYDKILGIKDYEYFDELDSGLTFNLWYHQTFGAWKLLNSICDNVYQWCLVDVNEIDKTFQSLQYKLHNPKNPPFDDLLSKYNMSHTARIRTDDIKAPLNPWNNLVKCPDGYDDWDNYIDLNQHPQGHLNDIDKLHKEFFLIDLKPDIKQTAQAVADHCHPVTPAPIDPQRRGTNGPFTDFCRQSAHLYDPFFVQQIDLALQFGDQPRLKRNERDGRHAKGKRLQKQERKNRQHLTGLQDRLRHCIAHQTAHGFAFGGDHADQFALACALKIGLGETQDARDQSIAEPAQQSFGQHTFHGVDAHFHQAVRHHSK